MVDEDYLVGRWCGGYGEPMPAKKKKYWSTDKHMCFCSKGCIPQGVDTTFEVGKLLPARDAR